MWERILWVWIIKVRASLVYLKLLLRVFVKFNNITNYSCCRLYGVQKDYLSKFLKLPSLKNKKLKEKEKVSKVSHCLKSFYLKASCNRKCQGRTQPEAPLSFFSLCSLFFLSLDLACWWEWKGYQTWWQLQWSIFSICHVVLFQIIIYRRGRYQSHQLWLSWLKSPTIHLNREMSISYWSTRSYVRASISFIKKYLSYLYFPNPYIKPVVRTSWM